jgi:hypothetical protein
MMGVGGRGAEAGLDPREETSTFPPRPAATPSIPHKLFPTRSARRTLVERKHREDELLGPGRDARARGEERGRREARAERDGARQRGKGGKLRGAKHALKVTEALEQPAADGRVDDAAREGEERERHALPLGRLERGRGGRQRGRAAKAREDVGEDRRADRRDEDDSRERRALETRCRHLRGGRRAREREERERLKTSACLRAPRATARNGAQRLDADGGATAATSKRDYLPQMLY